MIALENQSLDPDCRYHVLIVEDDLCLKTILSRVLGSIDPHVSYTWATSVEEAQTILSEMKVSLVISDLSLLGERTGIDLWEHCGERFPKLPFLMVSGMDLDIFSKRVGRHRIAPPFLPKPFRAGDCRQMVNDLLEPSRASSYPTQTV
jgi:DNA-binding NtrC family response regulator